MMQKNEVASLSVQPLILKVVVRPVHSTVLGFRTKSQHGYLVVVFLNATSIQQWLDHGEVIILHHYLTTVAITYISKGSVIFYWKGGLWKFFKFCKFLVIPCCMSKIFLIPLMYCRIQVTPPPPPPPHNKSGRISFCI